jgi:hypothetical protein
MADLPDGDAMVGLFAVYGMTMAAIQGMEQQISLLYVVANSNLQQSSTASAQRQLLRGARRGWQTFQKGTSGMKLNDAKVGVRKHLDPDLYAELDAFVTGPRNQLAHRFLIERLVEIDKAGTPALLQAVAELNHTRQTAKDLADRLLTRTDEILATWPPSAKLTREISAAIEEIAEFVVLKQFPSELREQGDAAQSPS